MQIFTRMACNSDSPWLFVVLELAMTTPVPRQLVPAIAFDLFQYVPYFHGAALSLVDF